jgi:predicted amidophosphoribosyltransferase
MKRERKTIKVMIKIFCKRNHKPKSTLCKDCQKLLEYAFERLSNCSYKKDKPTCRNCVIHCFKEPEKSKLRKIMRYSGPRILFTNPILAINHLIDGFKNNPK